MGVYKLKLKRKRLVKVPCDLNVSHKSFFYLDLGYFSYLLQREQA